MDRAKLMEMLDEDLEEFMADEKTHPAVRERYQMLNQTVEEQWEEMKKHPAFMTEYDPSQPMSAEMEALMKLKYETGDADDRADSYREDGNHNFQKKKYHWAIDSYTEGIKIKCPSRETNAILYSNRAAANFYLGNYRSALFDCVFARKFKPDHMKAIIRGAQCCVEIKRFERGMKWCDSALLISPEDTKVLELRSKAEKLKKALDRDKRKELLKEKREQEAEERLVTEIQKRGINLASMGKSSGDVKTDLLKNIEPHNRAGAKVYIDSEGKLHWPVMFFYPEYQETDFNSNVTESDIIEDHLYQMFEELPSWDAEHKYKPENLQVYFEDHKNNSLVRVKKSATLGDILKDSRYTVYGGTPGFIVIVKDSDFSKSFLKRYEQ